MIEEQVRSISEEPVEAAILPVVLGGAFSLGSILLQYHTQRQLLRQQRKEQERLMKLAQQHKLEPQHLQTYFEEYTPTDDFKKFLPYLFLGGSLILAAILLKR